MSGKGEKNSSYNETVIGLVNMAEHDNCKERLYFIPKMFLSKTLGCIKYGFYPWRI